MVFRADLDRVFSEIHCRVYNALLSFIARSHTECEVVRKSRYYFVRCCQQACFFFDPLLPRAIFAFPFNHDGHLIHVAFHPRHIFAKFIYFLCSSAASFAAFVFCKSIQNVNQKFTSKKIIQKLIEVCNSIQLNDKFFE